MMKLLDRYWVLDRVFPATLTSIPAVALWFALKDQEVAGEFFRWIEDVEILESVGLYIILLFAIAIVIQNLSKLFQKWYFEWDEGLPTTYFMKFSDETFSAQYKEKYRSLIKAEFGLELLDTDQEQKNPETAKKLLDEACDQVRVFVGKGELVHDKNILYGFVRNLTGGAVLALLLCLSNVLIARVVIESSSLIPLSIFLAVPYVVYLVVHKPLLIQTADSYARQLISEFIVKAER